jgi:hypothetical protein
MKPVKEYFYSESEWDRLGCGPLPANRVWKDSDPVQEGYLVYPEAQSIDSDEKINPFSQV